MNELKSSREDFLSKRNRALTKLDSFHKRFLEREKRVRTDLEEAGGIWKKLDERFKWWWWQSQSLP
jgi:hypothetical protein